MDILFDRYMAHSIKGGTRSKRSTSLRKIRTKIASRDTKLPSNWASFIELDENKADLANFLCEQMMVCIELSENQEFIISGGFEDPEKVVSLAGNDVKHLGSDHEEADTRILLQAADAASCGVRRLVIHCRDTDVLLLLIVFAEHLSQEIWMKAGTSKNPRYIKVHSIAINEDLKKNLLALHSLSGCDTTSQFAGIAKTTAWNVYKDNHELLCGLGEETHFTDEVMASVEAFVCKLYDPFTASTSIEDVRCMKFRIMKGNIDNLPPTRGALVFHIQRANYQALTWNQCLKAHPDLPSPTESGWQMDEGKLTPKLLDDPPVEKNSLPLTVCGCKEEGDRCGTRRCLCSKGGLCCTKVCGCERAPWCMNSFDDDID